MTEDRQIEIIEPTAISRFRVRGNAKLVGQETVILHIKNIGDTRSVTVNRITHQTIFNWIADFPNTDNYFLISMNRDYQEGGNLVTPLNIDDDRKAPITSLDRNPLLMGEGIEVDRIYTKEVGDRVVWDDTLILKPQDTLSLSYVSTQAGGLITTRVAFNA